VTDALEKPGLVSGFSFLVYLFLGDVLLAEPLRYRGDYTFGHEVNIFCPEVDSRCYWLAGDTPDEVALILKQAASADDEQAYRPVCIVVEGEIDREMQRSGFAADYDGYFTATRVYDRCAKTTVVTHADLRHHRWLLESIDGHATNSETLGKNIPELDFGEGLHVSGNSGCNRFTGQATLREERLVFSSLASTRMACPSAQSEMESLVLKVLSSEPRVRLTPERQLILATGSRTLEFRLRDWVE
jgi:heat shock protein HslJ